MVAPTYIKNTSTGLYKYRRRTPKELIDYIPTAEVVKSLGRNYAEAIRKSLSITQLLDELTQLTQLQSIPKTLILSILSDKLDITSDKSKQKFKNNQTSTWTYLSTLFIQQSNVTPQEHSSREYFYLSLMPNIFKVLFKADNLNINLLTYEKQLAIRDILLKIPKKNIYKYRSMDMCTLILGVHKGTLDIKEHELMATASINKDLKRMKSLLLFAQNTGTYNGVIPSMSIETKNKPRGERRVLTKSDLRLLDEATIDDASSLIIKILKYTGMRLSELYKASLVELDGVLCFDLREPNQPLKTLSSYRIIPVHKDLINSLENLEELLARYSTKYMTKHFGRLLQRTLEDTKGKSLYSLRHTFATELIAQGIQPELLSELMGHAHSTMTMNRYVKGYPVVTLKAAIDTLYTESDTINNN